MLSVLERQKYLKDLGFYSGELDGMEGPATKAAYKALQDKYFTRKQDKDGFYGENTEKLLINAWRVAAYTKNFTVDELKCECDGACTGYPAILDIYLLANLQALRDKYGATTVTSALRCEKQNTAIGGIPKSLHKEGRAVDFRNKNTATLALRQQVMNTFKTLPNWRYTYCNVNGNYPNMGNCIHIDVK